MGRILIIEDDALVQLNLAAMATKLGHQVACAASLEEGLRQAQSQSWDLVLLDIRLPDGHGLAILPELRGSKGRPEVIVLTGYADPDDVEQAIHQGAWDYLEKPVSSGRLRLALARALQFREERRNLAASLESFACPEIIGRSPALQPCLALLRQAAASEANVLITGETGTGKELFARAIHGYSARAKREFVVVDCAALPETLVESLLFGHKRGAFTGAVKDFEGLVRQADGGTLFLDEVGELDLNLEKVFLRVLEARAFVPVGGKREVRSNFRLIAATNRNLSELVQHGRFRRDLLYRLSTIAIHLPPLRERREDLGDLAEYFISELCACTHQRPKRLTREFLRVLAAHDWPGNIRELRNVLEQAVLAAREQPVLFHAHLPKELRIQAAKAELNGHALPVKRLNTRVEHQLGDFLPPFRASIREATAQAEQSYLRKLMAATQGDIKRACGIAQLSKTRVYDLLKKYNIPRAPGFIP